MNIDISITNTDWWKVPIDIKSPSAQEMMRQHMQVFDTEDTYNMRDDSFGEVFKRLTTTRREGDPLFEIFMELSHRGFAYSNDYNWRWGEGEALPYDYSRAFMAAQGHHPEGSHFAKMTLRSHTTLTDRFNPYASSDDKSGVLCIDIAGHGFGDALLQTRAWRLSPSTKYFLEEMKPFFSAFSNRSQMMQIGVSYTKRGFSTPNSWYASQRDTVEIDMIMLQMGSLSAFVHVGRNTSNLDRDCRSINHYAVHLRPQGLGIENYREPVLVCSHNRPVQFALEINEKLSNLMLGDTPTPEEMLMIEMAGFKKEEFWVDNVPDFDRLRIKPFNLKESIQWYEMNMPRFHF